MVLFRDLTEGQRIYTRLFEKKDMERTLKHDRRLSAEGRATHKASISFAFPEQDDQTVDLLDCACGDSSPTTEKTKLA